MSREAVAKYWRAGGDLDDGRSARSSGFDGLREVIEAKAKLPGVTKKAVHEYLLHTHPDAGLPGYNAFAEYCRKRGIAFGAQRAADARPRFETPPGRQMQFDWKEDVRMVDANGEVFEFNMFSATLGYSRLHKFTYSATRTADDLLACLLGAFRFMGGVPHRQHAVAGEHGDGAPRQEREGLALRQGGGLGLATLIWTVPGGA